MHLCSISNFRDRLRIDGVCPRDFYASSFLRFDLSIYLLDELARIDSPVSCWGRLLFTLDIVASLYSVLDRASRGEIVCELVCILSFCDLYERCAVAVYLIADRVALCVCRYGILL